MPNTLASNVNATSASNVETARRGERNADGTAGFRMSHATVMIR
jgi:hypothetical protein